MESFYSLGLHHLSELPDDLDFISCIFCLGVVFVSDAQLLNEHQLSSLWTYQAGRGDMNATNKH